jgi:molybdate/tungstate transport system substrate-binding protein
MRGTLVTGSGSVIALATVAAIACVASVLTRATQETPRPAEVVIYHAGSLNAAFDDLTRAFTKKTGIPASHKGMGSVEAARRTTIGKEPCDIYASADYMTIDALLKPVYADYSVLFAQSRMVLTYTTDSRNAASIADPSGPAFAPPTSVPNAAANWYTYLAQPGVKIAGSDPSADPGGYRALMVMQLAEPFYRVPTLYEQLHKNHMIYGSNDKLGTNYDYGFAYEHSARASARSDPKFRYVMLPSSIDLSDPARAADYGRAEVTIAGLAPGDPSYVMRGTRAIFGLTILKSSTNKEGAVRFLQFMFSTEPSEGVAVQRASGAEPINPPMASSGDYDKLPPALRAAVMVRP